MPQQKGPSSYSFSLLLNSYRLEGYTQLPVYSLSNGNLPDHRKLLVLCKCSKSRILFICLNSPLLPQYIVSNMRCHCKRFLYISLTLHILCESRRRRPSGRILTSGKSRIPAVSHSHDMKEYTITHQAAAGLALSIQANISTSGVSLSSP